MPSALATAIENDAVGMLSYLLAPKPDSCLRALQAGGLHQATPDVVERLFGFKRMMPCPISTEEVDADLIICTHEHLDHMDIDALPPWPETRVRSPGQSGVKSLRKWEYQKIDAYYSEGRDLAGRRSNQCRLR
jgi:hypothetical protein